MIKQVLIFFTTIGCIICPMLNYGQIHTAAAPSFNSLIRFAIFTGTGAIDNVNTTVNTGVLGDIGTFAGAITIPVAQYMGQIHNADAASVNGKNDVTSVYNYLGTLKVTTATYSPNVRTDLGISGSSSNTLNAGVYFVNSAITMNGNITLDAQNDPNAVFIILVNGAFNTAALSTITLANQATASNVYWYVTGAVSLYANTTFVGNLVSTGALSFAADIKMTGRALIVTGAIHLNGTTFTGAAQADSIAAEAAAAAGAATATVVKAKVYLQGAINTNNTSHSATLSTNGLIPYAHPYSAAPFNHATTSVERVTLIPTGAAGVVDWVMVELLDPQNNNAVVDSRIAFLKQDGSIVDAYGTTGGVSFLAAKLTNGKAYNIGIRHRNHLAVRTAVGTNFVQGGTVTIDFTAATNTNIYSNSAITNNAPMATLTGGAKAMWAGDINNNGIVSYVGYQSDAGNLYNTLLGSTAASTLSTYNNGDLNFDGNTSYIGTPTSGASNDADFLFNTVLKGIRYSVIYQHY